MWPSSHDSPTRTCMCVMSVHVGDLYTCIYIVCTCTSRVGWGQIGTCTCELIDLVVNRQLDVQLTQAENERKNEKEQIYVCVY